MWTITDTVNLLTTMFHDTGTMLATVLGGVVGIVVAMLALGFSLHKIAIWIYNTEVSYGIPHHFGALPYKGYNRWRSPMWNRAHTAGL